MQVQRHARQGMAAADAKPVVLRQRRPLAGWPHKPVPAMCPIEGAPAGSHGRSRANRRDPRRLRKQQVAGEQRHRLPKLIVRVRFPHPLPHPLHRKGQAKPGILRAPVGYQGTVRFSPHGLHGFCSSLTYALHPLVSLGSLGTRWVSDRPRRSSADWAVCAAGSGVRRLTCR